jgi:hypothetical protein
VPPAQRLLVHLCVCVFVRRRVWGPAHRWRAVLQPQRDQAALTTCTHPPAPWRSTLSCAVQQLPSRLIMPAWR